MLLESSFKESKTFWARNAGYMTFHSIMLGFTANIIKNDHYEIQLAFALCGIGFVVSLLHFLSTRSSVHYNKAWYMHLESWVKKRAETIGTDDWKHLYQTLVYNDRQMPFPNIHSTTIATLVPCVIMLSWIVLALYLKQSR
jgi:hypothetical protein